MTIGWAGASPQLAPELAGGADGQADRGAAPARQEIAALKAQSGKMQVIQAIDALEVAGIGLGDVRI